MRHWVGTLPRISTTTWEQRKLGDIGSVVGGNAWKSQDYVNEGTYLVVTIANVTGNVFIDDTLGNRIDCDTPDPYLLHEGDILISLTGNVGRVSKMTATSAVLNQRVGKINVNQSLILPHFLFHVLRNSEFEATMIEAGQGAAQKNISNKDVLSYLFSMPLSLDEQDRIGSFFQQIDSLITLHQRKLSHLQELKKGLLQQMFV